VIVAVTVGVPIAFSFRGSPYAEHSLIVVTVTPRLGIKRASAGALRARRLVRPELFLRAALTQLLRGQFPRL
jgi:hypothetical protein